MGSWGIPTPKAGPSGQRLGAGVGGECWGKLSLQLQHLLVLRKSLCPAPQLASVFDSELIQTAASESESDRAAFLRGEPGLSHSHSEKSHV